MHPIVAPGGPPVPVLRVRLGDRLQRCFQVGVLLRVAHPAAGVVVPRRPSQSDRPQRHGQAVYLARPTDERHLRLHAQPLRPRSFLEARSPLPSCPAAVPDPGCDARICWPSLPRRRSPAPARRSAASTAPPSSGAPRTPWRPVARQSTSGVFKFRGSDPLPTNDSWIAAHAMETGADLVSANRRFEHLDGIAWVRLRAERRSTWPTV